MHKQLIVRSISKQEEIWTSLKGEKYIIGCNLYYNAIANQLIQLLLDINSYDSFDCVAIVHENEFRNNYDWYMKECSGITLITYNDVDYEKLSLLDIMFFGESNYDVFANFPKSIVKIGCQHGVDIDISKSINNYGGGFCFDYILGIKQHEELACSSFVNKFPECLRFHSSSYVCEIPFGLPKFDSFFNKVTNCIKQDAIIYHLSYLEIEQSWVVESILPTLKSLLTNFPDYQIIFRPYHLDRGHEIILKCTEYGHKFGNFIYSDADNYTDDYCRGAVMLMHREYAAHLFDLATGRPSVILLSNLDDCQYNEKDRHYICQDNNVVSVIRDLIGVQEKPSVEQRNRIYLESGIYNPGKSVEYFVDNIDYIISGRKHPGWKYYDLKFSDRIDFHVFIGLHLLSCKPANMFFVALSCYRFDYPQALLFAADSYSRINNLKFYYYRHALVFFYRLVSIQGLNGKLSDKAMNWWRSKGCHLLEFIQLELTKNHDLLNEEEMWLKNVYDLDVCDEKHKPKKMQVLNVDTFNPINKKHEVILYGAGEFAINFLEWNAKEDCLTVVGLVDSDTQKHGSILSGMSVLSPAFLNNTSASVLICSKAFLPEIYIDLVDKYYFKNDILIVSNDPISLELIDVI